MSTRSQIYYKPKEILSNSFPRDRLSRISSRLKIDAHKTPKEENTKSHSRLSKGKANDTHAYPKAGFINRKIISTMNAIFPARLYSRALLRDKNLALKMEGWNGTVTLSQESLLQLDWWIIKLPECNGKSLIPENPAN